MDSDNLIESNDSYTWVKCGHKDFTHSILLSERFAAYFICCDDCYDRLIGHIITGLVEPFEKLTRKIK